MSAASICPTSGNGSGLPTLTMPRSKSSGKRAFVAMLSHSLCSSDTPNVSAPSDFSCATPLDKPYTRESSSRHAAGGRQLATASRPRKCVLVTADAHLRRGTIAVVLDVDGVVTPVNGASAWGDDVYAGDVFGPVHVSSSLVTRLDKLHAMPGVQCWWLTSWTSPMRAGMDPFPGPLWPMVADPKSITNNSGAPC